MTKRVSTIDEKSKKVKSPYLLINIDTNNINLKNSLKNLIMYMTLADATNKAEYANIFLDELEKLVKSNRFYEDHIVIKTTTEKMIELGGKASELKNNIERVLKQVEFYITSGPIEIKKEVEEPNVVKQEETTYEEELKKYYIYKNKAEELYQYISEINQSKEIYSGIILCKNALDELNKAFNKVPKDIIKKESDIIEELIVKFRSKILMTERQFISSK